MLISDSLCLNIIGPNNILVAVGNQLQYHFTCSDSKQCETIVLPDLLIERIHGICVYTEPDSSPSKHLVVCYGGKELVQVVISSQTCRRLAPVTTLNDWISACHLSVDGKCLVLLTSHGVAVRMGLKWTEADEESLSFSITEYVKCPDKSTLYCSRIVDDGRGWPDGLLFFGGTAFGQMVVWAISNKNKNNSSAIAVLLHRIDCHNGVLLSINCNLSADILTTTSDDRSVKIWRFINNVDISNATDISIKPLKTLFGHTGRVFRCKLISLEIPSLSNESTLLAMTGGEDNYLCIWNVETGSLLHRKSFGSEIWHIDYEPIQRAVYVSCADGNYKQLELTPILLGSQVQHISITNNLSNSTNDEHITKVRFVENGYVVVVTNHNRLACGSPETHWTRPEQIDFKVSLLEAYQNRIAIAGYKLLNVFDYDCDSHEVTILFSMEIMDEMIRSCHFLSNEKYLLCGQSGQSAIVFRQRVTNISEIIPFRLSPSKEPWATAVLAHDALIFLSDRRGHLNVYEIYENCVEHRDTLKYVHGRIGCTSLQLDSNKSSEFEFQITIVSAGHDGTLKHIRYDLKTNTLTVCHTIQVPITWVQTVLQNQQIIAGFNANKFVVWDPHAREFMAEIDCGGGHRYSDLHCPNRFDSEIDFVFLRNKTIKWIRFRRPTTKRLLTPALSYSNWHSLSCTTVATMATAKQSQVIVSGGDDNLLKIHIINQNNQMQHMTDIFTHVSSIKSIFVQTISDGYAWRIFSAGGRAQICITEISIGSHLRVNQIADFMLRMSDAQRKRLGTANTIDFDPETRFMSLILLGSSDLFVGCSDGYIRHFKSLTNGSSNIVLKSAVYYDKCILQVTIIDALLVSAATDGKICFWQLCSENGLNADSKPIAVFDHHDSGIQSMDWLCVGPSKYKIVTGGDDQRVVLSSFEILDGIDVRLKATTRLEDVHTAQVNGVCFFNEFIYTTGVDQTVYRWNLEGVHPRRVARSCVADIKGISMYSTNNDCGVSDIIVYGHGVQTFSDR